MATNIYAKTYKMESKARKPDKVSLVSYVEDSSTFSVVHYERLVDIDALNKAWIQEKDKMYHVLVVKTGNVVK